MNFPFLQFYFDLAFNDGVRKIQSEFLGNNDLLKKGFIFIGAHETYHFQEMIEDGEHAVFKDIYIDREKFLQNTLDHQKEELYSTLKDSINKSKEIEKKGLIDSFFNEFLIIYKKIESKDETDYNLQVLETLKGIIKDLKIQYQNTLEHHKLYNKVKTLNNTLSYFQYKDFPMSFFEKLYDITIKLDLIDDIEIDETTFIDLLTIPKSKTELKISFIKSNPIVAYYLKQIEPFFNDLNAGTIEKSQSFINKQGKPLKSTDLYAALSRGKNNNEDIFKKIDSLLNPLKKEFLK